MKYSSEKTEIKHFSNGLVVKEYHDKTNPFPIDACVVEFKDDGYPWKKNKDFYEMFYIVSGELNIEFENGKIENLKKDDVFIVEPNILHRSYAKDAKIFIVCNPPFNIDNVEGA